MSQKVKMIASGHEDHFVRFFDPNSSTQNFIKIKSSSRWQLILTVSQDCSLEETIFNCLALVMMELLEFGI